jgi:hypothetical protein
MNNRICAAILSIMMLQGCAGAKKVSGNIVNYPQFESITIDKKYENIGNIIVLDEYNAVNISTIFVKRGSLGNEVHNFIIALSRTLDSSVYFKSPGQKKDRYFRMSIAANSKVGDRFSQYGLEAYHAYFCGEFYIVLYHDTFRSMTYCISSNEFNDDDIQTYISSSAINDMSISSESTRLVKPMQDIVGER